MTATLVELLAEAKRTGDYQALLAAVPYSKFLGLSAALDADGLVTTMTYGDHLIGNPTLPALHGGTLGALLESAAIFELMWRAETIVLPKTITVTFDYLRSARPADVHARATITRQGRRVCNVRAVAWQADPAAPVATAHAIFLVKQDP
ncbi:MAG: PaaI family thioesterase [Proteobacteria bacterium]|nr:PaaI family thioesterase [Pseudomonadota bacterium]